jgi:hypothetical protein
MIIPQVYYIGNGNAFPVVFQKEPSFLMVKGMERGGTRRKGKTGILLI